MSDLNVSIAAFIVPFSTLLAIVDPLACVGPFLAMTENSTVTRKRTAMRAVLVATAVLIACAFIGNGLFAFYGITLPALKISGGLLLFVIAFEMLYAKPTRTKSTEEEHEEGLEKDDIAVFPLAIPLLAGPGAIISVLIFMDRAQAVPEKAQVIFAILLTMAVTLATFAFAGKLARLLSETGINIFTRLMGLVLGAISAQFMLDGLKEAFPNFLV
jgi:multiple antibiotic resistance protein